MLCDCYILKQAVVLINILSVEDCDTHGFLYNKGSYCDGLLVTIICLWRAIKNYAGKLTPYITSTSAAIILTLVHIP